MIDNQQLRNNFELIHQKMREVFGPNVKMPEDKLVSKLNPTMLFPAKEEPMNSAIFNARRQVNENAKFIKNHGIDNAMRVRDMMINEGYGHYLPSLGGSGIREGQKLIKL